MSARAFTILDAIEDARLFGGAFRDPSTWRSWLVFLAGLFALPMSKAEVEVWRECTGRSSPPSKPFPEAWLVCGRRSGKSFIMALLGVYLACFRNYQSFLGPGEKATVMIVAADRKAGACRAQVRSWSSGCASPCRPCGQRHKRLNRASGRRGP
jgi:hypothetical protein